MQDSPLEYFPALILETWTMWFPPHAALLRSSTHFFF